MGPDMTESWRNLDGTARADLQNQIAVDMRNRYRQGRREYGDTFQGDPIDHAYEEAIDAVFYLAMAKRQRDANG